MKAPEVKFDCFFITKTTSEPTTSSCRTDPAPDFTASSKAVCPTAKTVLGRGQGGAPFCGPAPRTRLFASPEGLNTHEVPTRTANPPRACPFDRSVRVRAAPLRGFENAQPHTAPGYAIEYGLPSTPPRKLKTFPSKQRAPPGRFFAVQIQRPTTRLREPPRRGSSPAINARAFAPSGIPSPGSPKAPEAPYVELLIDDLVDRPARANPYRMFTSRRLTPPSPAARGQRPVTCASRPRGREAGGSSTMRRLGALSLEAKRRTSPDLDVARLNALPACPAPRKCRRPVRSACPGPRRSRATVSRVRAAEAPRSLPYEALAWRLSGRRP